MSSQSALKLPARRHPDPPSLARLFIFWSGAPASWTVVLTANKSAIGFYPKPDTIRPSLHQNLNHNRDRTRALESDMKHPLIGG
jgi:hypothetical protein